VPRTVGLSSVTGELLHAPDFSLGYRPALDGLRGVSVLAVMAYHVGLIRGGYLGVDAFFVLSGFLITALLVEERRRTGMIHLGKFYVRRALRLLPALVTMLAVGCLVAAVLGWFFRAGETPAALLVALGRMSLITLFYVANWAMMFGTSMWILGHTWSLSIEEQFYLLWPLTLMGLFRFVRRRAAIFACVLAGAAASVTVRNALFIGTASIPRVFLGFDTRCDALLIGCGLGLLAAWGVLPASRARRAALGVAGAVALVGFSTAAFTASWQAPFMLRIGSTLVALAVAVVIAEVTASPGGLVAAALAFPPLRATGRISYGLYLWHFPIIYACGALRHGEGVPEPWRAALALTLTFAVSGLSFWLVERPMLRLKMRVASV
jgi:peptidoglycan/LPS O-acetylase OafA/YrhL